MSTLSRFLAEKRTTDVLDSTMAYVSVGEGDPIVFLHGNPTSSILWRDVIPEVQGLGRCIAPDLIGMGDSGKRPADGSSYRFFEHRRYLDAFMDAVVGAEEPVVLVVHDWGSALGFDWANRHRERVRGIVYMEAIVGPMEWSDWPAESRDAFRAMRSPAGEELVLQQNLFVEQILPAAILRDLSNEEMAAYRAPFLTPEDRWPTLQWPRELPIDGQPDDTVAAVDEYSRWLAADPVPKLFVNAEPGVVLTGRGRAACRSWPEQTEVTVEGLHYVQEDSGAEIGRAIAAWLTALA